MFRACSVTLIATVTFALGPAAGVQAAGPTFAADKAFAASELSGLKSLGTARWTTQNDELVGRAARGSDGWLILPLQLSNLAGYAEFRCDRECAAGILFRAEPTANGGLRGVLLSSAPKGGGVFAVEIDAQGREVSRAPLQAGRSDGGLASSIGNVSAEGRAALGSLRPVGMPPGVEVPGIEHAKGTYRPGEWNSVNFIAYNEMLRPSLNGAPGSEYLPASLAPASVGGHGAVALYIGGSGTVRFRNVLVKDLNKRTTPAEIQSPNFKKLQLDAMYYSWGPAVADFNKDGRPDVAAGPFYYEGPEFTVAHEIYTPVGYNPATDYPQVSFINLSYDFNKDGWDDVLTIGGSAGYSTVVLYLNPKGQSRHWDSCVVLKPIGNEETVLEDVDGDGKPELIHAAKNAMAHSTWDEQNPCTWTTTLISEAGPWGAYIGHGIGVGDLNGDGRRDILSAYGWWEQPEKSASGLWRFHPQAFGRRGEFQGGAGGAQLGVYDVNGDGLNDVVTPLEGHGFGLAWYEHKRGPNGVPTFVQHTIMDGFLSKNAGDVMFTEPHASAFADIDGDGVKDFITGKRYMSHLMSFGDPDPFGAPVLYVYRTVRNAAAPGGAEFVPELVNNRSGVGSHLDLSDVNGDGKPDIVTSGALGTFVFFNQTANSAAVSRTVR